jgi:hypothetical protein
VYIPFVSNSIRNYAVLHIPLSECRVFQTKERAPFMVAVELYRPDELNLYSTQAASSNDYESGGKSGGAFAFLHKSEERKSAKPAYAYMSDDSFK